MTEPEPERYTFALSGVSCPTQAEGMIDDRWPWYFRYRHGRFTLQIGQEGSTPDGDWILTVEPIAHGTIGGRLDGSLSVDFVRELVDIALATWLDALTPDGAVRQRGR